jgi:peptidoglycan/xylan/chitin deacetylase (PgdA/CDA1 family)
MPKSVYNPEPFQQAGKATDKLNYLVDAGYEVGNHTWSHRSLRRLTESQVTAELVRCFYGIRALCPKATMDTLCIPFGEYPRFPSWRKVLTNPLRQVTDMHSSVLMAWGGPSYSPFDKRFDNVRITRIGVSPNELENTLTRLSRTETWYVSGGEAGVLHVPAKLLKYVSKDVRQGLTVKTQ